MPQEVIPTPDEGAYLPDHYGPTRAARDSYAYAELERQAAVERQALLMQGMYFGAFPYFWPPAYYPLPLPAYVYGPESARRAARTAARHGYPYPYPYPPAYRGVVVPLPGVPSGIAAQPNVATPAPGNGKTWVSPDGYVYRPWSATVPPGTGPLPETSPAPTMPSNPTATGSGVERIATPTPDPAVPTGRRASSAKSPTPEHVPTAPPNDGSVPGEGENAPAPEAVPAPRPSITGPRQF